MVTPAAAATQARFSLAAILMASLAALVVMTGRADGAGQTWNADLAPAGACRGADELDAAPTVQEGAVACLINWARARKNKGRLGQTAVLRRAAALKGQQVVACGQFSHTPCGADLTASLTAAGYRYARFGENLYSGPWGRVTPRQVVAAWLASPGHRANILGNGFRHVATALIRADGRFGNAQGVVWVAAFASPR